MLKWKGNWATFPELLSGLSPFAMENHSLEVFIPTKDSTYWWALLQVEGRNSVRLTGWKVNLQTVGSLWQEGWTPWHRLSHQVKRKRITVPTCFCGTVLRTNCNWFTATTVTIRDSSLQLQHFYLRQNIKEQGHMWLHGIEIMI